MYLPQNLRRTVRADALLNLVTELLNTVGTVNIIGLDNMNDYYDVSIKEYRLEKIRKITGLDLREFDHAVTFKVALMVKKYLTNKPTKFYPFL